MASSTSSYSFTEDEVTQLARCTDQAEFLYLFKKILQSKSIDLSAVFDAQTTLGASSDYCASLLARFFEAQSTLSGVQTLFVELTVFPRGAKGGNSPVGRTQARDPTAKPEVGRDLSGRGI